MSRAASTIIAFVFIGTAWLLAANGELTRGRSFIILILGFSAMVFILLTHRD
jgi:hypothetical protein